MSGGHAHGGPECLALFAQLSDYMDGELDAAGCAAIDEHMADCAPCQKFLESLRRAVAHVKSMDAPSLPESFKNDIVSAYERARRSS